MPKKSPFTANQRKCLFLKYMCNEKLERSWFPFYLRMSISGSPIAIPSKIENLAHPPTKQKCWCPFVPLGYERVGTPRTPTSADLSKEAECRRSAFHQAGTPGGTRSFENMMLRIEIPAYHTFACISFLDSLASLCRWPMLDFASKNEMGFSRNF